MTQFKCCSFERICRNFHTVLSVLSFVPTKIVSNHSFIVVSLSFMSLIFLGFALIKLGDANVVIIVTVVAAAIVLLLIIFVLVMLFCRRRRKQASPRCKYRLKVQ